MSIAPTATSIQKSSASARLSSPRNIWRNDGSPANFPGQFSDEAELLLALGLVGHDRPHDQCVDARVAKRADLLLRFFARADDRDEVDQLVGKCEHRLGPLPRQVKLLDFLCG